MKGLSRHQWGYLIVLIKLLRTNQTPPLQKKIYLLKVTAILQMMMIGVDAMATDWVVVCSLGKGSSITWATLPIA